MKDLQIEWTHFALRMLDDIYDYLLYESKSSTVAQRFINKILDSTDHIKQFPESGQEEPYLKKNGQDSRYIVVATYKVIYQHTKNTISLQISSIRNSIR